MNDDDLRAEVVSLRERLQAAEALNDRLLAGPCQACNGNGVRPVWGNRVLATCAVCRGSGKGGTP